LAAKQIRILTLQLICELLNFKTGFRKIMEKVPVVRNAVGFGGGSAAYVGGMVGADGKRLEEMQQCGWVPLREGGSAVRNAVGFGGGSAS